MGHLEIWDPKNQKRNVKINILVGKKMLSKLSSSMSEVTSGSSETFGKKMLQKMGWSEGKGLGKSEQGVTSHVRVKKREEAVGIGADVPEQMDDQWWYNVYNKAAAKMPGSSKKKKKGKKGKKPGSIPTDEELFAACGGARLGMRARGSCPAVGGHAAAGDAAAERIARRICTRLLAAFRAAAALPDKRALQCALRGTHAAMPRVHMMTVLYVVRMRSCARPFVMSSQST